MTWNRESRRAACAAYDTPGPPGRREGEDVNACICGHSVEEHPKGGACEGTVTYRGKEEPCRCAIYEEDHPC
jgi:hypothetical protein